MILVTFALPDESRPFLHRLTNLQRVSRHPLAYAGRLNEIEITVCHMGMGRHACERSLKSDWLLEQKPDLWIAAGVAGALNPALAVAQCFYIQNFSTEPMSGKLVEATMLTRDIVVDSAKQKQTLHRQTGADLIDMETEWIAESAGSRRIPLLAIRSVSDDAHHDFAVPSDVCFDTERQRPRIAALLTYLALHPRKIRPFARFVSNVGSATRALAQAIVTTIEETESCKSKTA